jgi:predicted O-methyltransferase YrrM
MPDPYLVNHILSGIAHVLRDRRAEGVLNRLYWEAQTAYDEAKAAGGDGDLPSVVTDDFGYPLAPRQGEFLYLVTRAMRIRRAVVHAVSAGAAAIYIASALRDSGGGTVYASDPRQERIKRAAQNVSEAGLDEYVELRASTPGSAFAELQGPIDLAVLDCWDSPATDESAALGALRQLEAHLSSTALIVNENAEPDYISHVRSPQNTYRTSNLGFGVVSLRSGSTTDAPPDMGGRTNDGR